MDVANTTTLSVRPRHRRRPEPRTYGAGASVPEPLVRIFARRVQQVGALDLTQGDYKNADFAPHPEVVRAAQRISRNSVHSYGAAAGRMEVRSEIAAFINRDGLIDYPSSGVQYRPDEVLFTPGTRSGLSMALEVLGAPGSGVVVPRPSWEYDWFIERVGKRIVELPTSAPEFLPDPEHLERLLARGGVSCVILNNPHNPTGRVYPRELVEALVRVAVSHRAFVLYDSVYQSLDYFNAYVNPAFATPEWRDWVVTLSGLSKMDRFGASTGIRACWMIVSDRIRIDGVRAGEIIANLSAWLVATPSTLAQDWALAALQSPLGSLRRPSPSMRERRDFMVGAVDSLSSMGIQRTDCGGTFYAPLAFPGLVGEQFDRLRNGIHERAVVRNSQDAFEFLLSANVGGIPFSALAGRDRDRYGTWQRLSYGSKDLGELAVFIQRVRERIEAQMRLGSNPPPVAAAPAAAPAASIEDFVWQSRCTVREYAALDTLEPGTFAAARRTVSGDFFGDPRRLTGTKHPDATAHRAEQLARARRVAGESGDAARVLDYLEWIPLLEARQEYDESIRDLLGSCNEVLLDFEGRHISPEWLEMPERIVLALLHRGLVPGEDCHLLFRVPNPCLEPDEEKLSKILGSVARANLLFHLACRRLGLSPRRNAIAEITIPQINSRADLGALHKVGALYIEALESLFSGPPDRVDSFLTARIPARERSAMTTRAAHVRFVPLVENVGALAHLPDLLEEYYLSMLQNVGASDRLGVGGLASSFEGDTPVLRVFVAMSDTATSSGKLATDLALGLALDSRPEAERRLRALAERNGLAAPTVTFLVGAGRAGFRGGFAPEHDAVIGQLARADGVCVQGIRADAPEEVDRLVAKFHAAPARNGEASLGENDRLSLHRLLELGVRTHTNTLLRIAPLVAQFGGLVPQTRVRIRATGSANYGRSIPEYAEEWGGGRGLPDSRELRESWPEGVALPRAITFNLACTTLGLPAVVTDLAVLDKRAAMLIDRHLPGYREIMASELPQFVREAAALVFGLRFAESIARDVSRAAGVLWIEARPRQDIVLPTCLFSMMYLRYLAEESDSWDEAKDHEGVATRAEELIRDTGNDAFHALCAEQPGGRWATLQTMVGDENAVRLLMTRELSIEEKREFVDLRISDWLRTLEEPLARELRGEWSRIRRLGKPALTLSAIEQMIALEQLRGSRGA